MSINRCLEIGSLLAVILLSGCGGGASPGATAAAKVTVGAPTPNAITLTTVTGESLRSVDVSGIVSGDLASLQGKDLHVVVVDPDGLFNRIIPRVFLRGDTTSSTYHVRLNGTPLTKAGHFTGNLRISICHDVACNEALGGTPILIPYDVTVYEAITLSRTEINVSVPFGTVPAPETVNLDWSTFSQSWQANISTPYTHSARGHQVSILPQANQLNTTHQLQLQLAANVPGEYADSVSVMTPVSLPGRNVVWHGQTINIKYTITPNPAVDYVFYPARHDIVQKSQSLITYFPYSAITNTNVTANRIFGGVEYLSAAGTTGPVNSWWSEYPYQALITCSGDATVATNCLAPGRYTAQVRYRLTTPNGSRDILFPISLTITP